MENAELREEAGLVDVVELHLSIHTSWFIPVSFSTEDRLCSRQKIMEKLCLKLDESDDNSSTFQRLDNT